MTSTILIYPDILINPGSFALHCLLFQIAQGFHGHGMSLLTPPDSLSLLMFEIDAPLAWFGPGGSFKSK